MYMIHWYYKHTAFSWGCYGRLPHEGKISHSGKRISPSTSSRVIFFFQSVIFFPERIHLP